MKKKEYVAGFLFSDDYKYVVLIKKNKPEWQKGLLNGVGGSIEEGETSEKAMTREFKEETGVWVPWWNSFAKISGKDWIVYFFYCDTTNLDNIKSMTDEKVDIYPISELHNLNVIPNLRWLIPMCLDNYHIHAEAKAK